MSSYTVEARALRGQTMDTLVNATLSLMGCLVLFIVADYKLKRWLRR